MIKALLYRPHQKFSSQVDLSDLRSLLANKHAVLWLDVQDPTPEDLEVLRGQFDFHELAIEDAVITHERSKLDEYESFYFLVFYSIEMLSGGELKLDELDLFVGSNYMVAVHTGTTPVIDEALRRWQHNEHLLVHGVGSLLHALLDSVVDDYFRVADRISEQVANLEEQVFNGAGQETLQHVFTMKKRLLTLRRLLGPERDVLNGLMRRDIALLDNRTILYLRDVYDHLVRVTDSVDLHSDLLTSVLDVYLSSVSNRLNQIVKTLTSVTIILMTMSLVAGIYGMNFRHMPELDWPFGYPLAIALMVAFGVGLYLYLRKKDWI